MADFALLLIGFIFAGWALFCFDPKTRFLDESKPDYTPTPPNEFRDGNGY